VNCIDHKLKACVGVGPGGLPVDVYECMVKQTSTFELVPGEDTDLVSFMQEIGQ
jgi:hypothetical protein